MTWIWTPLVPTTGWLSEWCRQQGSNVIVHGDVKGKSPPVLILLDLRGLDANQLVAHVTRVRTTFPGVPLAVVSKFTRDVIRLLARTAPVELILEDEVEELQRIVSRLIASNLRERLATMLTAREDRNSLVARATRLMLADPGPPRSISGLARRLFVSESTLRARWRSSALPGSPKALDDWSIVCALAESRQAGQSLAILARRLRVDASTVYRVARRLLGCSPTDVTPQAVLDAAHKWMEQA